MANSIISAVMKGIPDLIDAHTNWNVRKFGKIAVLQWWGAGIALADDGYTFAETIREGFRPYSSFRAVSKVYNGSVYVDCVVAIDTQGVGFIRNLTGGKIDGIDTRYLQASPFVYYSE
jgi:hypothetical protein